MMKEYYIEDDTGQFWCEDHHGYWSKFKDSLKHRFEGIYIWVFPLYLHMRICRIKCQIKRIDSEEEFEVIDCGK